MIYNFYTNGSDETISFAHNLNIKTVIPKLIYGPLQFGVFILIAYTGILF